MISHVEAKPHLRTLLKIESLDDPRSLKAQDEIHTIAQEAGLYLTASLLHRTVATVAPVSHDGSPNYKSRGFELVGEYYFSHVMNEIDAIESAEHPMGPVVFREYCSEMFECLLSGDNVRKGVGFPIMIMERLLDRGFEASHRRDTYFALAVEALSSTAELSQIRFEKDQSSMQRTLRKSRKGNTPPPVPKPASAVVDQALMTYLLELKKRLDFLTEGLKKSRLSPSPAGSPNADLNNHLKYLASVLKVCESSGYRPFAATIKEKIGTYLYQADPAKGASYLQAAGVDFEAHAGVEEKLHFIRMCAMRYKRALGLYGRAQDKGRAEIVQTKLSALQNHYNPRLLKIARL